MDWEFLALAGGFFIIAAGAFEINRMLNRSRGIGRRGIGHKPAVSQIKDRPPAPMPLRVSIAEGAVKKSLNPPPTGPRPPPPRSQAVPGSRFPEFAVNVPMPRRGVLPTSHVEMPMPPGVKPPRIAPEKDDAIRLARRVLDQADAGLRDPDDDLTMLSRQFLRALGQI